MGHGLQTPSVVKYDVSDVWDPGVIAISWSNGEWLGRPRQNAIMSHDLPPAGPERSGSASGLRGPDRTERLELDVRRIRT